MGRNPKAGTKVDVPAKKIPFFKPSKELKALIDASEAKAPGEKPSRTTYRCVARDSRHAGLHLTDRC